jgi:quercetin dioxygenase-like cupin family protein
MAKAVFLGPGEGRQLLLGTNTVTFKAVTGDTEGRFSVMEHRLAAHGPHPPMHVHDQLDHAIYVLEGTVVFTVEQRQLTAPAGSFALIPHGTAHTFAGTVALSRKASADPSQVEAFLIRRPRRRARTTRSWP